MQLLEQCYLLLEQCYLLLEQHYINAQLQLQLQ